MKLSEIEKLPPKQALTAIEAEIKKGQNPEKYKDVLDKILGTAEPKQDAHLDEMWERGHRPE